MMNSDSPALLRWLDFTAPQFHAKALELRAAITRWLEYVPESFPHYTSHTISHSDALIRNISHILFQDDDPKQLVVDRLSIVEAYIIIASAFLHDAGMVASDKEKAHIMQSDHWKTWVAEGQPRAFLGQIHELRNDPRQVDSDVRSFLADIQLRFLLADYVRRQHHERSGHLACQHQATLGRFAFDDPGLVTAISDTCVAHGLDHSSIEDSIRFPSERDIFGHKVNLQFCAILLRLGDLLDLRTDRACPLLLNAACPLPPESIAHWTQYRCIKHINVAPDVIEIRAECTSPDEHRILYDWFTWLVNEVELARRMMPIARRHRDWSPPIAAMKGKAPTIIVKPAEGARYRDRDWRFILDEDTVFQRFVRDVHSESLAFVRELLQNSLDATRCRLFSDMEARRSPLPDGPSHAPEELLTNYPVRITLHWVDVHSEATGLAEQQQVLTVDDCGIGMNEDTIRNYLLQVGRSWYTTLDFRRSYHFTPTSRFGVGFLSVFNAGDNVVLDTLALHNDSGPLRLELTGPRNYILIETGSRTRPGTSVSVRLRHPLEPGALTKFVSSTCLQVEFPIEVIDLDAKTIITRHSARDCDPESPNPNDSSVQLAVREFALDRPGLDGRLFVFVERSGRRERWDRRLSYRDQLRGTHPLWRIPELPSDWTCLHGIALFTPSESWKSFARQVDIRAASVAPNLDRREFRSSLVRRGTLPAVADRWRELLDDHLLQYRSNGGEGDWQYLRSLASCFDDELPPGYWGATPMTPGFIDGEKSLFASNDLLRTSSVTVLLHDDSLIARASKLGSKPSAAQGGCDSFQEELEQVSAGLSRSDTVVVQGVHLLGKAFDPMWSRQIESLERLSRGLCAIRLVLDESKTTVMLHNGLELKPSSLYGPMHAFDCPIGVALGVRVAIRTRTDIKCLGILNSVTPIGAWFLSVLARDDVPQQLGEDAIGRLVANVLASFDSLHNEAGSAKLARFLERWLEIPNLPREWIPPTVAADALGVIDLEHFQRMRSAGLER